MDLPDPRIELGSHALRVDSLPTDELSSYILAVVYALGASQLALVVKNLPVNTGGLRDMGSIPGWGRSPGGGNGKPLQHSCLENPMDRGTWRAIVHRVAKSRTRLKRLSTHACTHVCPRLAGGKIHVYIPISDLDSLCDDVGQIT